MVSHWCITFPCLSNVAPLSPQPPQSLGLLGNVLQLNSMPLEVLPAEGIFTFGPGDPDPILPSLNETINDHMKSSIESSTPQGPATLLLTFKREAQCTTVPSSPLLTSFQPTQVMGATSNTEKSDAPDADIILRTPERDFRVHKLVLSLASPVFKDLISQPRPTAPTSDDPTNPGDSEVEMDVLHVADPAEPLGFVLRIIYPSMTLVGSVFTRGLDTLMECLDIARKYKIEKATSQLSNTLSRCAASDPLRVYAMAYRFGFTDLVESTSDLVVTSADLTKLPSDFDNIPATVYHDLVKRRMKYLEKVVQDIEGVPLRPMCVECLSGNHHAQEVFRLRLVRLIMTGTPVDAAACLDAWRRKYGSQRCASRGSCVVDFICSAIPNLNRVSDCSLE